MTNKNSEYLSIQTTQNLKGIFAIIIIIGHLKQYTPALINNLFGNFLSIWAYLIVGGFFFFSGYGLLLQYRNRGNQYIRTFPVRRLLTLYLSCLIIQIPYVVAHFCTLPFSIEYLIKVFLIPGYAIGSGWYIQSIFFLYLLFYLFFLCFPKVNRILVFLIITVIYTVLSIVFNSLLWYQSVFAFFLGAIWAEYKNKIDAVTESTKNYVISLLTSAVIFAATLLLGNANSIEDSWYSILAKCISVIAFVVLVLLILKKICINNPVFAFLGKISLELYCIHIFFLSVFRGLINNEILFWTISIVSSIAGAFVLNVIISFALSFLNKKKSG